MNGFQLLDDEQFDDLTLRRLVVPDKHITGMCPDCPGVNMVIHLNEYKCPHCKRTECAGITSLDIISCDKKILRRQFTDYAKSQRDTVAKMLRENNESFSGDKFQKDILNDVADQYNNIQTGVLEDVYDECGRVKGKKKFVKRSNVKNEIIAALIFFECNRRNIPRKPKDIANFMRLNNDGFSAGEDVLRRLVALGQINIVISEEPYSGFVQRYLESLDIEESNYIKFIVELIEAAELKRIGMNSLPPSKVAGCIWLLIQSLRLDVSIDTIETTCDNTKKNTFIKFYNAIMDAVPLFLYIFQKYGISVPRK
jgi:transcription initiation factor TFIIIB Brf1 subunit/transcription initiation factor TFIIB